MENPKDREDNLTKISNELRSSIAKGRLDFEKRIGSQSHPSKRLIARRA